MVWWRPTFHCRLARTVGAPPCFVRHRHGMHAVRAHHRLTGTPTTLDSFVWFLQSHSTPQWSTWWSKNAGVPPRYLHRPPLLPASCLRWTLGRVFTTNRRGLMKGTCWCHRRHRWSCHRWDMAGQCTSSISVSLTRGSYWPAGAIC